MSKTAQDIFKDNLRYLRKKRGWTKAQVAVKLRIKEERYKPYETRTIPDVFTLMDISNLYEITIPELFSIDIEEHEKNKDGAASNVA